MIQTSVAVPIQARLQPDSPESELLDPLLRLIGDIHSRRVLILAERGLDLMCTLMRHGCPAATAIRVGDKPDADDYDLVVVPPMVAPFSPDALIRLVHGALAPNGRLIVCVPSGRETNALARRLRLSGFLSLRSIHLPNLTLLQAKLRRVS